jgi:hypothetical protein
MIRQLARCPYCGGCEIALDDQLGLTFNPDAPGRPCAHLAWIDGRFAEWELDGQGVNTLVGSTEFRWDPPEAGAAERTEELLPYLKELLSNGPGWAFAPKEVFAVATLSADEKTTDARGHVHPRWEVDGAALFSSNPAQFWAQLPDCQERQLAVLDFGGDSPSAAPAD